MNFDSANHAWICIGNLNHGRNLQVQAPPSRSKGAGRPPAPFDWQFSNTTRLTRLGLAPLLRRGLGRQWKERSLSAEKSPFNTREGEAAIKATQWGQKPITTGFFTAFPQSDENLSFGGMGCTTTAGTSREQAQKFSYRGRRLNSVSLVTL